MGYKEDIDEIIGTDYIDEFDIINNKDSEEFKFAQSVNKDKIPVQCLICGKELELVFSYAYFKFGINYNIVCQMCSNIIENAKSVNKLVSIIKMVGNSIASDLQGEMSDV